MVMDAPYTVGSSAKEVFVEKLKKVFSEHSSTVQTCADKMFSLVVPVKGTGVLEHLVKMVETIEQETKTRTDLLTRFDEMFADSANVLYNDLSSQSVEKWVQEGIKQLARYHSLSTDAEKKELDGEVTRYFRLEESGLAMKQKLCLEEREEYRERERKVKEEYQKTLSAAKNKASVRGGLALLVGLIGTLAAASIGIFYNKSIGRIEEKAKTDITDLESKLEQAVEDLDEKQKKIQFYEEQLSNPDTYLNAFIDWTSDGKNDGTVKNLIENHKNLGERVINLINLNKYYSQEIFGNSWNGKIDYLTHQAGGQNEKLLTLVNDYLDSVGGSLSLPGRSCEEGLKNLYAAMNGNMAQEKSKNFQDFFVENAKEICENIDPNVNNITFRAGKKK